MNQPKQPSLGRLSRERPTEGELLNYEKLIVAESDRGAAIMAGALVENALQVCISSRIADPGEKVTELWFEGPTAPFGTFGAKITLGRALAIYGEGMEGRLIKIKGIRNAFAHRSRPLDFQHPTVAEAVSVLSPDPEKYKNRPNKVIFGAACIVITRLLIADSFKHGGKELEVTFP